MSHPDRRFSLTASLRRDHWPAALLILFYTLLFFHEAVFQGKLLAPIDAACPVDVVWHEACGQISVAQNGLIGSDQAAQFYPWRALTQDLWGQGVTPLWNPYNFSGYPLQANAQSAIFYPVNLAANLLPLRYIFTFSAVVRLFIAAFSTYLLARTLQISFYGGLVAGLAYAFSTGLVVWLGYAIIEVMAFLPLLLYFTEKLLQTPKIGFMFAAGLALGSMGLGGHPQTLLISGLTWAGYGLGRLVILRTSPGSSAGSGPRDQAPPEPLIRTLVKLAGVGVLGAGLAAVQLLPTWQVVPDSWGYHARGAAVSPGLFQGNTQLGDWLSLILVVWPNFFGNPAWPEVATGGWLAYRNYNELAFYGGVIPLILAPLAFFERRRRRTVWLLAGALVLAFGMFLQLPLFYALSQWSLLAKMEVARFRLFAGLGLALLAGYGLDVFLQKKRLVYTAAVFSLLLVLSLTVGQLGLRLTNADVMLPGLTFTVADMLAAAGETPWTVPLWAGDFINPTLVFGLPLLLAGLLLAAVWLSPARSSKLAWVLVGLTALDLFVINAGFNTALDPDLAVGRLVEKSETITFLQQTMEPTDRFVALGPALLPNSASMLGLSDVRGYDITVANRYHALFAGGPGYHRYGPGGFFLAEFTPVLNILSANYLLTPRPLPGRVPIFEAGSGVLVYHLPEALPRAYLVQAVQVLAPETIRDTIIAGAFDPRATALIEEEPPAWWSASTAAAAVPGPVHITAYHPNEVTLEVDSPVPAFLVLTDGYHEGWNVYVDGAPQAVYRTNYVVRGLFLPAGRHQVRFAYEPLMFRLGAIISLISVVVMGAGLGYGFKPKRGR